MTRSPFDFYDQFIWKLYGGCTRCGTVFTSLEDVKQHCKDQTCEPTDDVEWLE